MSLTTALAFYGAILSSILLGWNIYRDLTDRGKLRVHCYIGKIITPGGPEDKNDYLVYSVTNIGRQAILVTHVGGKTKKHDFFINPRGLPKMLKPGEYLLEYTTDLSALNGNLVCLWALDSMSKAHKVKKSVVKDLIKKRKEKQERSLESTTPLNK